ncbi:hypothetical protein BD626DRAFT_483112 [Schizophyllum amplum]|uniref:Uncharacterized protein n=1 Tax=Schizophyllum amplum TaxID=97359 RepID=A0A550CP60_9AGAR|nr:hypothetical protein BD626DRAFT_483112 [Auriculariopsis ampla]
MQLIIACIIVCYWRCASLWARSRASLPSDTLDHSTALLRRGRARVRRSVRGPESAQRKKEQPRMGSGGANDDEEEVKGYEGSPDGGGEEKADDDDANDGVDEEVGVGVYEDDDDEEGAGGGRPGAVDDGESGGDGEADVTPSISSHAASRPSSSQSSGVFAVW